MVEERGAALGARGCCYIAVVVGGAVEEILRIENEAGLVLQELVADASITQKTVGVHCVGHVASVEEEVGKNAEDDRILYYENELTEFRLVEPFASIEAGREAFDAWWEFRAGELEKFPVFEWLLGAAYPTSNYLTQHAGVYDSDWQLRVPLLGEDGRESRYMLLLCYRKDKLIAETVLQLDEADGARVVKERISDKDPATGKYSGLDGIDYAAACQRILPLPVDRTTVKGVGFDGESYFVVYR